MLVSITILSSVGDWTKRLRPALEAEGFKQQKAAYVWTHDSVYETTEIDWNAIMKIIANDEISVQIVTSL